MVNGIGASGITQTALRPPLALAFLAGHPKRGPEKPLYGWCMASTGRGGTSFAEIGPWGGLLEDGGQVNKGRNLVRRNRRKSRPFRK